MAEKLKENVLVQQQQILNLVSKIDSESAFSEAINCVYSLQKFVENNEEAFNDNEFVDKVYEFIDNAKNQAFSWKLKKDNTRIKGIQSMMNQLEELKQGKEISNLFFEIDAVLLY